MNEIIVTIGSHPLTWGQLTLYGGLAIIILLITLIIMQSRSRREQAFTQAMEVERTREMEQHVNELNRLQMEMSGRMQTIAEVFGSRQSDMVRALAERLDGLQHRVGQSLESTSRHQNENLAKLNERLALIDAAQKNLSNLTGEIVGLKDVLSNKQTRGAYGQGRMEAIIRDGLPIGSYQFQVTLSNGKRPDCLVHLPGDERGLVIDAKFPLEAFNLLREAKTDDARKLASAQVRNDLNTHIKAISERYFIAGETQDIALLFVPAESIYADIAEYFDDIVQKAHKARIMIVSPSLLTLAIQVMQSLVKDARIREEAHIIQTEVQHLLVDVTRLSDRVAKLDTHFRQAQDDVAMIRTSTDKITKRGQKIEALEFEEKPSIAKHPEPDTERLPVQQSLRIVD
ncbi:DNA recombination protein RmuC [Microvirga sp. W0021]|uniref:DNA recombination protein RmuC homolog n=1 Tax=Hohaiivirga grylli TaxID=3133970 RepID=A0ABV0BK08_9HYPH